MPVATVESLDLEGRGVARHNGKVVFIEWALAGELVSFEPRKRRPKYDIATAQSILRASALRVEPRCPYFGTCGGCTMQHVEPSAQLAAKQRALEDSLWHIARLRAERILPPISGPAWEYRHRARLSVRYVPKKQGVLIGFHERHSSFVADMKSCEVLPGRISRLLPQLRALAGALSVRDRLPQIEIAIGAAADVLVLRIVSAWLA